MPDPGPARFGWIARHVPSRESLHQNRLLRPFARQLDKPELWRMHRRSVPRGVALGLGVGIIIPFMHTIVAALLAIPLRANIAIAAIFTLLVNPLTIPPLYYAAYRTGLWELHTDAAIGNVAAARHFSSEIARLLFWVHEASAPIALGILTLAVAAAVVGYFCAAIVWRYWQFAKLRRRRRAAARPRN